MKYYQGQIENRAHAYLKAEAGIKGIKIADYINGLIVADLQRKGYELEADTVAAAAPVYEDPAANVKIDLKKDPVLDEAASVFDFFDKNVKPMSDYYRERVGDWIDTHGPALTLLVFKHALDASRTKEGSTLVFIDRIFQRVLDENIKTVEEFEAAQKKREQLQTKGKTESSTLPDYLQGEAQKTEIDPDKYKAILEGSAK